MDSSDLVIRQLKTVEEHLEMEELQAEIWCRQEVVPMNQTITAVKNGGIALGLFEKQEMVGFCYGFAGFKKDKPYLCSHMLGLKEKYRYGGWGEKLKLAQREEALSLGYDLITWTFDPLESPNAYLNIFKLRGIVRNYIINCYGEMRSNINIGLPSDRFVVEWHIETERVLTRDSERPSIDIDKYIAQIDLAEEDPYILEMDLSLEDEALLFPIPINFQQLKCENPRLALDWRLKSREVFESFFARGYVITDFVRGQKVNWYVLEKEV